MGNVVSSVVKQASDIIHPITGIGAALTPQNEFQSNSPIDVAAMNQQIANSQGNFGTLQAQQQNLAKALLAQSQGEGPNPAQAMLNQATDRNIKQGAGMIASTKGINPALAARMAMENAGKMNTEAAGQAATLGAQQQLHAQNALSNLYGNMTGQNLQNVATSGGLANQASLGSQGINAGVNAQNAAANQNTFGGFLNGGMAALAALNKGGEVPVRKMAGGGMTASQSIANQLLQSAGIPIWEAGNTQDQSGGAMGNLMKMVGGGSPAEAVGGGGAGGSSMMAAAALAEGGEIPAHMEGIAKIYHGYEKPTTKKVEILPANPKTASLKSQGGDVPGKAKVKGDSLKNDTVPTLLSPGEMVIPRSVMQSEDPVSAAADFVAQHLKKNVKESKGTPEEFKKALQESIKTRKAS